MATVASLAGGGAQKLEKLVKAEVEIAEADPTSGDRLLDLSDAVYNSLGGIAGIKQLVADIKKKGNAPQQLRLLKTAVEIFEKANKRNADMERRAQGDDRLQLALQFIGIIEQSGIAGAEKIVAVLRAAVGHHASG